MERDVVEKKNSQQNVSAAEERLCGEFFARAAADAI
jgi:hypothetical protein